MIVYKFGGASVNTPDGVRNLASIVHCARTPLIVIVSAMGKTTNALEEVLEKMLSGDTAGALKRFADVEDYHNSIIEGLMGAGAHIPKIEELYEEITGMIRARSAEEILSPLPVETKTPGLEVSGPVVTPEEYDLRYDELVSYGELISTAIISHYLSNAGVENRWIDMRRCLVTDTKHRAADVIVEESVPRLKRIIDRSPVDIFIGQGFIGGTLAGETTTLGREGSDYTAAVVANMLDADEVVIWKDVPGILNADPRIFPDTMLIPQLTYLDAVELAYSGAQIIHPKTIKPLQNKSIPLYVRPFADPLGTGSVIKDQMDGKIEVPILILKNKQVLISIRPKDFSFVLEDRLEEILSMFSGNGVKVNLIQTSAVNLSLCVDAARTLGKVVGTLHKNFRVVYNDGMELLTIRGYTPQLYARHAEADGVFLSQRTRRIVRIVRKVNGAQ